MVTGKPGEEAEAGTRWEWEPPECLGAPGVFWGAPLTPGHGGDDLAEGATAQLVLGQDAELVTGVRLQVLHQKVLSPRRH